MILTGQINGMEIMLMVKLKKDVLRGGNMYSGWEQKMCIRDRNHINMIGRGAFYTERSSTGKELWTV